MAEAWKSVQALNHQNVLQKQFRIMAFLKKIFVLLRTLRRPFLGSRPSSRGRGREYGPSGTDGCVRDDLTACWTLSYLDEEKLPTCFDMDNLGRMNFFTNLGESTELVGVDDCDDEESTTIQTS